MGGIKTVCICVVLVLGLVAAHSFGQQLAFPGAEGFGRFAEGGRGGEVYHVTNLADIGPGSFRDAVSKPGRTVVFDISGVIKITDKIKAAPQLTIAGQSALGEGIVVYGNGVTFSGSTIVRYMRFRGSINMPKGACTVVIDSCHDVILDHVSIEWGRWDDLHIKDASNITLQYCLVGEPIDPQRFGALFENPTNVTINHCLWIDNQSRNPKAKASIEYINNVIYNYGSNGFVGGHSAADHFQDVIGNYTIAGPNSGKNFIGEFAATDHVFQQGNYVDVNKDGLLNGRLITNEDFAGEKATVLTKRTFDNNVKTEDAAAAFKKVFDKAGASLHRDAIDNRLIGYLKSLGKDGMIFKSEVDAGGQPDIPMVKGPADKNGNGMPDSWEQKHPAGKGEYNSAGLNKEGYTRLEVYLNSLAVSQ